LTGIYLKDRLSNKMRILQLTQFFAPVHGGSSQVPYHLSRALARRGHEVTLCTSDYKISDDWIKSAQESGVEVYYYKTWLNLANLLITPGLVADAKKRVKGFDIIHMHSNRTFQNIVVQHYASKYDVPYVLQAHGTLPRMVAKQWLKLAYDAVWGYKLLEKASKVVALTSIEAEQYKARGLSARKIEIVPNGIDISEFNDLPEKGKFRSKHGLASSQKIILYLGRIHVIKGLDLLAQAFAEPSGPMNDIKLVIAGPDDGYLPALRALVKALGIEDKVLFTGPLWGIDKLEAYVDSEAYVLPSAYDSFPITVLEALACGVPVIMSDRCAIASAVDGKAGILFSYGDKEQLKRSLVLMLNDDKMRQRLGDTGKILVREQFSWEKIAAQLETIYEGVKTDRGSTE
jgi:glycosyltransferase involved in cell wall biosynthesis